MAFGPRRGADASLLYSSADRGATWSRAREFPGERIVALEAGPDSLLAVGTRRVHRLAGSTWTEVAALPAGVTRVSVGLFAGHSILYGTSERGEIQVSEDGGATWRVAQTPTSGRYQAIAAAPGDGRVAYAGFRGMRIGGEGRENTFNGISKTTDGGRTWTIVHQESNRPSKNLLPSWIESRAPEGGQDVFFDTPWSLGVAPTDPNICYATDLFRTYRTLDGGATWETVTSVRVGENTWTTRGLDVTTNYGVHFDPFDPRHLVISYTDIGAFHSHDGGASWVSATNGVPTRLAQYHLLGGLRSPGQRPPLGRVQRRPRPAAPENVAQPRSEELRGRRRHLRRRRQHLAPLQPGHAPDLHHPHPARSRQPRLRAHALRVRLRPRRLQVHR